MPIVSFDFEKGGKGELAEWRKPKSKNKKTQKSCRFFYSTKLSVLKECGHKRVGALI
jgi:hypothetical protein